MVLSFYIGFSFIRIAVTCAILERISGFEPSSEMIAVRYLKLVIIPSFYSFTLISLAAIGTVCHQFGLLLSAFYNLCKFSGLALPFSFGYKIEFFPSKTLPKI